ncbi:Hsp20 family protein [Candidatus Wolfebacteria bacterium]|nr:Hsp20 family protein [Candidatus Wolfebacteria bacterium]
MDKDTKSFFEKLAGINSAEETEFKPNIVLKNNPLKEESLEEDYLEEDYLEEAEGELTVDVYQTPNSFVIESTIAGVDPENIDILTTPESISIRGKREKKEKIREENYIHQECYWGAFSRKIIFPEEIDPDRTSASIKNGVLKINLPKLNKGKSKKIKVKFE